MAARSHREPPLRLLRAADVTGMLASVRSLAEARLALRHGADIIDLKSPAKGVLGAVPKDIQRQVVAFVDGRRPVSATVGDLPAIPEVIQRAVAATRATGVDLVKVGFFEPRQRTALIAALTPAIAQGVAVVAVLFADLEPRSLGALDPFAESGFAGVMLDTADKSGQGLRASRSDAALGRFVEDARRLGLMSGLAGTLEATDIAPLLCLRPDYLGFRGALCRKGRSGSLDPERMRAIRACMPQRPATAATIVKLGGPLTAAPETMQAKTVGGLQWLGE